MNHCLLEVQVKTLPTTRYTQDNQTAIAEMEVLFDGLRADDPQGFIKVVGWGNIAQDLQNNINIGDCLVIEGRLRMNTVPRQDGTKEKKAEFTLSKIHSRSSQPLQPSQNSNTRNKLREESPSTESNISKETELMNWNSSPLVPDTDEIPF